MYEVWKNIPRWLQVVVVVVSVILVKQLFTTSEPPPTTAVDLQQCSANNKGSFNGKVLYACTVSAVAKTHKSLQSPDARAAFLAQWQHKYDDTGVLSTEKGTIGAITEMLLSVKARYDFVFTPENEADNAITRQGKLGGVGAQITMPNPNAKPRVQLDLPKHLTSQLITFLQMSGQLEKPTAALISDENPLLIAADPEEGTPANKVGLKKGDRIFAVDGREVTGQSLEGVLDQVRGKPGVSVKLTVIRASEKMDFDLVRAMVDLRTTSERKIGEVGYLRINHFDSPRAIADVHTSLDKLCFAPGQNDSHTSCDAKAMVVDLRYNPGGIVDVVAVISELFVDQGNLLTIMRREGDITVNTDVTLGSNGVFVKEGDRSETQRRDLSVHFPTDRKLIVLVDENTVSGAEALASILQQLRGAIVVGVQTKGKGIGQCPIELPYGYAARLICMEYLVNGKSVDWLGVTPDVVVAQPEIAAGADGAKQDLQLETALAIARGERVVSRADADVQSEKDRQIVSQRKRDYELEVQDTLKRFFNK